MTTKADELDYEIVDPVSNKPIEDKSKKAAPPKEPAKVDEMENSFQVPDKFKGKSVEEVAKSYVELENLQSRQAKELGDLRKSVNDIITRELEQSKSSKEASKMEEELGYEDLIDNPSQAIRKVTQKDYDSLKAEIDTFKMQSALEKFQSKHPDYLTVAQDLTFQGWISDSPYRTRLFRAANQGDLEAADDLFSMWEEKTAQSVKPASDDQARQKALKGASTESGAASGQVKKRYYRRSDLINLRVNDPQKWEANSAEFQRAYAEGRVIDDVK